MLSRTFAKKSEKGNPLSREKAQARRDAHARSPNVEKMRVEISAHTMAVVAPLDLVAFKKISIIGYLVGVCKTEVMSPMPNKIAIENAIAKAPLMNCAINML